MDKDVIEKIQEFRKAMSDYRKTGRITECFHHKKNECKGAIKQSHSLQRNGRLSIVEGSVNGQQVVYTFTEREIDETTPCKTLKPIGKATASTFFGFCDYHDTALFSEIENKPFNDTDEHCFLNSYRSFAHSYHRKKEEAKAYQLQSKFTEKLPKWRLEEAIQGLNIALEEGEIAKAKLDQLMEKKEYDGLEYFTYILPEKYPIASSSVISPYYSYKGNPMNNHARKEDPFSYIMLTVLPDQGQTIIILACFPDDLKGVNFLDELEGIPPYKLEKAISYLLMSCAENTFFSPALWDSLGKNGQRLLCDELVRFGEDYFPTKFDDTKINFFDARFACKRLGC